MPHGSQLLTGSSAFSSFLFHFNPLDMTIRPLEVDMKALKHLTFLFFILLFAVSIRSGAGPATSETAIIRILTINVWSGLTYKGHLRMGEYETPAHREERYQALCSLIRQLSPDVIGINEANKLPDYAERLAKETDYEAFYHVGVGGVRLGPIGLPWNLREGDAILARKSLKPEFVERKQLSGGYVGDWATFHFSDATQIVAIKITVSEKPIYLFVTHWHSSLPDEPYVHSKAAELRDSGTISGDGYYVLMGDFNAGENTPEIRALLGFGMVDVYRSVNRDSSGFTWDPKTNSNYETYYSKQTGSDDDSDSYRSVEYHTREIAKRIDYIFLGPSAALASGTFSIVSSRVALNERVNGVHTSDHYGVLAEICINR
jgi:endonuclease/exonuclease/phosphatase family metal-dependent hydrolase